MKRSPLFLTLLILIAACTTSPRGVPPSENIGNFGKVNEDLYRGAQPNRLGLQTLKRVGIKSIVNLRMTSDVWQAEAVEASANGMIYTNVPMRGLGRPTSEQVAAVLSIIATFPSPVFVHCEHGCDRTGTIVACYRIKHDQRPSMKAQREAMLYGMSKWEVGMKSFVADYGKTIAGR